MENSIGSALDKIKLQEQDTETKLKEKRELEATISCFQRNIKETLMQVENSVKEQNTLVNKICLLKTELDFEKIRNTTMAAQIQKMQNDLKDIQKKIDTGIKMVWDQRSNLCETIQNTSDKYDVWALLVRPTNIETPRVLKKPEPEIICGDARLREAMMRRDKAIAERDRLKREPSTGDEFIRMKNALDYSLQKIENFKNVTK
ncbi:uncharacterized protein LOC126969505 [Leptidea sinapis]|uniref:uncharacterized protein LOC126969505 n=1 Tax=Leptidea sinapis TaxID=189913 RepID=UPI00213C3E5E|nr:uncharacterized protein LOC126969505 [Leptidea sinapis]